MAGEITPEMARAELARRRGGAAGGGITPEMARAELARRRGSVSVQKPIEPEPTSFRDFQRQAATQDPGALQASTTAGRQGATLGYGDELLAGAFTPLEMAIGAYTGEDEGKGLMERASSAYDRSLGLQRQQLATAREAHPVAATVGEIAGGAVLPAAKAKSTAAMLTQGMGAGAAYGFGAGEGGLEKRVENAAYGAAGGLGGAVVARGIGNAITKKAARKAIPSQENLEDASSALYDAADAARLVIKPSAFARSIGNAKLAAGQINTNLRPKTAGIVQEFEAMAGQPVSLRQFDELRQTVGMAMKNAEDQDVRTLKIIKDQMDAFADGLDATQVSGALEGIGHLKEARRLWSMQSKSEAIGELVERAKTSAPNFSGSGLENALRTEFRALAKNSKKMKMFSEAERAAILKVARGGPVENVMRMVGKFAPTGVVSSVMSGSAGAALGGGVGAVALPTIGLAARGAATAATKANVRTLDELIRSGGQSVPGMIAQGRLGQGPGALAVQKGQALGDLVRLPLATGASGQTVKR